MTFGSAWRRGSAPNEASEYHHWLLLILTQKHARAVNTFTHRQPMFLTVYSLILLWLLLRGDLRGWNWTSLGRSLVFCDCFFFISLCFLFVCFCCFLAAPAVRAPRRVGRRWTRCQEMMSWPASPLTLVCVWHSCTIEVWLCRPGCYCACVHVCVQIALVCGRILHSVCVHEETVPQQL